MIGPLVGVSAALIVLSSYDLWPEGMLAFGDLTVYPSNSATFVDAYQSAWSERGLGGPFAAGPAVLVSALLMVLLGDDGELAQDVYLAAWIPLAFAGMVYLCRRGLRVGWGTALAGGVLYATTPVAIGLVVAGAGGLIWAYALAPALIAAAEKVRTEGFQAVGWFAAALALLSAFSAELLVFGFLIAVIWLAIGPARHRVVPALAVALAIATIAALPGIFARGEVRPSERLTDKALVDYAYTYDKASLPRLLRLAGNQGDPMDPLGYNEMPAWALVGFAPCLLFVAGLLRRRSGDLLPLRLGVLVLTLIVTVLILALVADKHVELVERVPVLLVFRNPEKLMILLAAGLIAGAMYGIHRVLELAGRRRGLVASAALVGLVAYLALYAQPAFSGHWGIKTVRGTAYVADRELLAAARYLRDIDPSIPGKWRIAWVPFSATDVLNLEWVLPEWANDPVLESRDPEIEDANEILEEALNSANMRMFHSVADSAAVKYVVVRTSADPRVVRAIGNDPKLKRIYRDQGYSIWRNAAALPRIRSFSGLTAVIATRPPHPIERESAPIIRLGPNALGRRSRWTVHPGDDFDWVRGAVRVRAARSEFWPVLARRFNAHAGTSYKVTAWVRTTQAAGAHVKVIWYRRGTDPEHKAIEHDYTQPTLTGDHPWTRIVGVVKSPSGAKFGELMFLAGKRPTTSRTAAVSWVRGLQVVHYYGGDPAPAGADVLAEIPEVARPNHELTDAASLNAIPAHILNRMPFDLAVVNPTFQGPPSKLYGRVLAHAGQITIAAQAEAVLQPRDGVWRNGDGSVEVASAHAEAWLPLGFVPPGNYLLSVVGCRLGSATIHIVTPTAKHAMTLSDPSKSCGPMRAREPVPLEGRVMIVFMAKRGASLARVQATPVGFRHPASSVGGGNMIVTGADSLSPTVQSLSTVGLTLADAFHPGWQTSGSSAFHFRTLLGFNGFLVDRPQQLTGLSYGPQRTRVGLIIVSAIGWLTIVAFLILGAHNRRARLRSPATRRKGAKPSSRVSKRVRDRLQSEKS